MISIALIGCLLIYTGVFAQESWPRTLKAKSGGEVTIYQPQLDSLNGSKLTGRAAISVKQKPTDDPVFGAIFFTATMNTNRDTRIAELQSIKIDKLKVAGVDDSTKINKLKSFLEAEIPNWKVQTTLDEILTSIDEEQKSTATNLKNDPPKIIYRITSCLLVTIDGEPRLKDDDKLKMKRIINSPFLIVQYPKDNQYYLYGGNFWYQSASITSGYQPVKKLPKGLKDLDKQIKEQAKKNGAEVSPEDEEKTPPEVIVVTEPTELLQSDGEANYATIEGTNLLYVSNSENHIFKDISNNTSYVLISGRWYSASSINGPWTYVASDKLPDDFKKIPEGSDKDVVLANVAGTEQAEDAVMDAQIPQTAKVDRSKATCTVTYDGDPKFEPIKGTSLSLAVNTSSTVLQSGSTYYCVENGVWFKSSAAKGPWKVSDDRPQDVDKIPADNPAYNTQYVYVYETTPQYVYVGYTPAYMGCYVYGPTVVYGTGYYYNPWYGPYYYPRPYTYGFSMNYNPYMGWSMGFHYSYGAFSFNYYGGGYHGGYWGPPAYRPPYYPPYRGGMYGQRPPAYVDHRNSNINSDRSNNVYRGNNGVSTNDVKRPSQQPSNGNRGGNSASQLPAGSSGRNPSAVQQPANSSGRNPNASQQPANNRNNVMTDKQGNVYRQNDKGGYDQRSSNGWQQNNNANTQQQLNRDMQNRQQSQQLNNNFNQTNRGSNMGGARSGGGARGGGGRR